MSAPLCRDKLAGRALNAVTSVRECTFSRRRASNEIAKILHRRRKLPPRMRDIAAGWEDDR